MDTYAERPEISFQGNIISESIKLKEGTVTTENEQTIFTTNHINSKVNFYIEGNDSGGDVKGFIVLKRISDVDGNDVSKKEIEKIFTVSNLSNLADSDLQGGTFTLDLSSIDDYKDGLYEVKVYVMDSAGTKGSIICSISIIPFPDNGGRCIGAMPSVMICCIGRTCPVPWHPIRLPTRVAAFPEALWKHRTDGLCWSTPAFSPQAPSAGKRRRNASPSGTA